jgi:uncharacterized protein
MKELRCFEIKELRAQEVDGKRSIAGYAAVFNALSEPLGGGGFREQIAPGAFVRSLKQSDIIALWNHDPSKVLGRVRNKTLELNEDGTGLSFRLDLPNNSWGNDAFEAIRRGDVTGMSFGFNTRVDEWDRGQSPRIRTLKDVDLIEVSPTPFPAYPQTSVAARDTRHPDDVLKEQEAKWAAEEGSPVEEEGSLKNLLAKTIA